MGSWGLTGQKGEFVAMKGAPPARRETKTAFAAEKKFPFGNSKGRAPTALQLLLFEEMVPEVGVEPTRF
jgi:hypothetical protein